MTKAIINIFNETSFGGTSYRKIDLCKMSIVFLMNFTLTLNLNLINMCSRLLYLNLVILEAIAKRQSSKESLRNINSRYCNT